MTGPKALHNENNKDGEKSAGAYSTSGTVIQSASTEISEEITNSLFGCLFSVNNPS